MGTEAWTYRGFGQLLQVSLLQLLLQLLLLLPLAIRGLQPSPSVATFAGIQVRQWRVVAPPPMWVIVLCGLNTRHCRARGPACGWGSSAQGPPSLISSLPSPILGGPRPLSSTGGSPLLDLWWGLPQDLGGAVLELALGGAELQNYWTRGPELDPGVPVPSLRPKHRSRIRVHLSGPGNNPCAPSFLGVNPRTRVIVIAHPSFYVLFFNYSWY